MRKTLAVVVTTLAIGAFAGPAFAMGGCGGYKSAHSGGEVASAEQTSKQTTKPVQQSQVPTEQAQ